MRFRIAIALSVSILLIGTALVSRFAPNKESPSTLTTITKNPSDENFESVVKYLTTPQPNDIAASSTEPLTHTSLIGQQLIMDYVKLVASGEVSTNDVINLGNKRAEDITTLHTFKKVGILDIKIIPDNAANATNYAKEFSIIYSDYKWKMGLVLSDAEAMALLYEKQSEALKNLPVPTSVSGLHLELINIHASSAAGLRTIKEMESDPVKVLVGMMAIKENVIKEESALIEIERILREKYASI